MARHVDWLTPEEIHHLIAVTTRRRVIHRRLEAEHCREHHENNHDGHRRAHRQIQLTHLMALLRLIAIRTRSEHGVEYLSVLVGQFSIEQVGCHDICV